MGLPNASVSQCRRTEIYSWQNSKVYETHLDVDEISAGKYNQVPDPIQLEGFLYPLELNNCKRGTIVKWKNCDRLDNKRISTLESKLIKGLGQQFRYFLWSGTNIYVNGKIIESYDPLCLQDKRFLHNSEIFEKVSLPFKLGKNNGISNVEATFTQLPLTKLYKLSNKQKSELGITKGAGVSIIRAGREIDFGWFFMDVSC